MGENKTLKDMKPGSRMRAVRINGAGPVKRRLFDMGITPKTEIYLRKTAPLGDPVEVSLRGYELSLRKSEAGLVEVEPLEGGDAK